MAGMEKKETYIYQCLRHYDPRDHQHDSTHIVIEPGDRLEVDTPLDTPTTHTGTMEAPEGWLKGRNVTKGVSGLFPSHLYVRFLSAQRSNSITEKMAGLSVKKDQQQPSSPEDYIVVGDSREGLDPWYQGRMAREEDVQSVLSSHGECN
ncbi:hypothetical protein ACOMHN_052780 [Nucella lapillus]